MHPVPFNDQYRLEELNLFGILDTEQESCFDNLTSLARRYFGAPIALVSLVDESRQWFKSAQGLKVMETPRNSAFCAYAIMSETPFVVLDAAQDLRFANNPLVQSVPNIRFYAGAPLILTTGFRLGTFCISDTVARASFSAEDNEALIEFSAIVVDLIERARASDDNHQPTSSDGIAENAFTDLISYVAHEIRSPLANVGAVSRAFATKAFGPLGNQQYDEFALLLAENSVHIMDILDRMLDFGRMRSGDVKLSEEVITVADVFAKVRRQAEQSHPKRRIDITIPPATGGLQLHADRTFLLQMLVNLVDNAIKYSPESSPVLLSLDLLESGELAVIVEDHGYGLTAEEAEIALMPYRRIRRQDHQGPKGFGIGLPFVKRLMEMHGGILKIASVSGRGTRVTLKFPSYRAVSGQQAPVAVTDGAMARKITANG